MYGFRMVGRLGRWAGVVSGKKSKAGVGRGRFLRPTDVGETLKTTTTTKHAGDGLCGIGTIFLPLAFFAVRVFALRASVLALPRRAVLHEIAKPCPHPQNHSVAVATQTGATRHCRG